jgi:cell division protease FtsH
MSRLKLSRNTVYLVLSLVVLLLAQSWWLSARQIEVVPFSQFEQQLAGGRVDRVVVSDRQMVAYLKTPNANGKTALATNRVEMDVAQRLDAYKVPYSREYQSGLLSQLLALIAPAAIFVGFWYFFILRRAGGMGGAEGFLSIGKSHAKLLFEKDTGVTFADVAGVDEAKEELQEVVEFLKDPQRYGRLGAHIPKGVLLVGPPGTGKTLLARAIAGEARVTFLSTSGAEFVEMFVGVGAARVRDLFEQARKNAPAIIFIDELDALGRARGAYGLGGHDEKEQTLNQLLAEMDGFDTSAGVIILAATNRPEILDPALLRAGRFDRQVLVDRPDRKGRLDVLTVHVRKVRLDPDVKLDEVAAMTPGFAGADLANLVNEAALLATRRDAATVGMVDFTAAIERIVAGLEKKTRVLRPQERRTVAYHEMGHALVAMGLPGSDTVHKVSIIPRGIGALGYTIQRPTEDRFLLSREEMLDKLAVLLAGRAAEMLVLQTPSTGAADDLAKATDIARALVLRYGMSQKLGLVAYEEERQALLPVVLPVATERRHSEETAREIDHEVRATLQAAFDVGTRLLTRGRAILDRGAAALIARETLDETDLAPLREELLRALQ